MSPRRPSQKGKSCGPNNALQPSSNNRRRNRSRAPSQRPSGRVSRRSRNSRSPQLFGNEESAHRAIREHELNTSGTIRERESTVRADTDAAIFVAPFSNSDSGYESHSDPGSDSDSLFVTPTEEFVEWEKELEALLAGIPLPEEHVELKNPCTICFDNISTDSSAQTMLHCGHNFHSECINTWADTGIASNIDVVCPNCRYTFIPKFVIPIPEAVLEAFVGMEPIEVSAHFLEQCGTRQRRNYRTLGADDPTLEYITEVYLRRRADWLREDAPYGTAIYNAVRWMIGGRPPRNADLAFFFPYWGDSVAAQEQARPLGAVIVDREFLGSMVRGYLDIVPELDVELRSMRLLT